MGEVRELTFVGLVGVLLGLFFYGGLWWSVQKGTRSGSTAIWILGSMLVRTSIVLVGIYLCADGHFERILFCMAGFVIARGFVTWITKPAARIQVAPFSSSSESDTNHGSTGPEVGNAP